MRSGRKEQLVNGASGGVLEPGDDRVAIIGGFPVVYGKVFFGDQPVGPVAIPLVDHKNNQAHNTGLKGIEIDKRGTD